MTVQIKIENFQNIESLSLRVEGFCVLVGESNIGKSSVVRSLRCLTENTPAKAFLRDGKTARVQAAFSSPPDVTLQDGTPAKALLVEWSRDKSVAYKITKVAADGRKETEPFERVGRGTPDPIAALRFLRVDTEELQALIGLIPQGRYFWPLDDPNSIVKLIGELRSVVALNTALNTAKAERRGAKKERDFHERAAGEAEAALLRLKGSEKLDTLLTAVETSDSRWKTASGSLRSLEDLLARLRQIKNSYQPIKQECARLAGAEKLSGLVSQTETAAQSLSAIRRRSATLESLSTRIETAKQALKPVPQIEVPESEAVEAARQKTATLHSLQERVSRAENAIQPVPSVNVPSLKRVEKAEARLAFLQALQVEVKEAEQRVKSLSAEQAALEADHEALHEEFAVFLKDNPDCPLCGSALKGVGLDSV